jgi:invasion protein IalB
MTEANIAIRQGQTWTLDVTYLDPGGVPIDLTGFDIRMQIRTSYADYSGGVAPLADLTIGDGVTVVSAAGGNFQLTIAPAATAALPIGAWYYDCEIESSGGEVTVLSYGRAVVAGEVTR